MPYKKVKVKGGYKVRGPGGMKSKMPMSEEMAMKQMAALHVVPEYRGKGGLPKYRGKKRK